MLELHITVTQKHITQGKRGDGQTCPIGLALKDTGYPMYYITEEYLRIYPYTIEFTHAWDIPKDLTVFFSVSAETARWIRSFDSNQEVKPFVARFFYDNL